MRFDHSHYLNNLDRQASVIRHHLTKHLFKNNLAKETQLENSLKTPDKL